MRLGGLGDHFRCGERGKLVHLARFGDFVILAELASQITARRAKGKDRGARQKVIERLLFDRINAKARGSTPRRQHHLIALAGPDKTQAPLPVV